MSLLPSYQGFSSVYDALMDEAPYDEWLQFLLNSLHSYPIKNKKILDLGCGTGRLACMLAKKGYQMSGVDLSEEMLSMAAQRMVLEKLQPFPLLQQDMRNLEMNEQFSVIYSFCDSLNYLTEELDLAQTFIQVSKHLDDAGLFIFDMHSPYKITHVYSQGPIVDEDEDLSYIWIPEVIQESLSVDHHIHFFVREKGDLYRRFSEIHQQKTYTVSQIKEWLEKANLELLSLTADFTTASPTEESERLFFVTQKRN